MKEGMSRRRFLGGLAAGVGSFMMRGGQTSHKEEIVHAEANQRREGESSKEYGKRICKMNGEGLHKFEDCQINCHFSGGYSVTRLERKEGDAFPTNLTNEGRFDYPEEKDRKLDDRLVASYIKDKKIVLLGEEHGEDNSTEEDKLEELFPIFKENGFTSVCLEIDQKFQYIIDEFMQYGDTRILSDLRKEYVDAKETRRVLDLCAQYDFKVICIDDRSGGKTVQDSFSKRDARMLSSVEHQVLDKGKRAVVYIGAAHARGNKETQFRYKGDKPLGGGIIQFHAIKPLYRRLVDEYGDDEIGSISLNRFSEDIPYFYE